MKSNCFDKFSSDSIFEIVGFLSAAECCFFGQCCKSLKNIVDSDKIWDFYSLYRIEGFMNTQFENNYQLINFLKRILGYSNAKDFYVSFRQLQFNLLGWFRALPPFTFGQNGGLYCGRVIDGEFLYQLVDENGNIVGNETSFKIRYEKSSKSLVGKSYGSEGKTFIVKLGNEMSLYGPRGLMVPGSKTKSTLPDLAIKLATLPSSANVQRLISEVQKPFEIASCLGLFLAPYGSHGLEILHLSLHDMSDGCWIRSPNEEQLPFGQVQLHGLKIKGDPNVPAGQLSFCINIHNVVHPQIAIQRDRRTIVSFPPNSRDPEFISLDERCSNIVSWFRGFGQINRRPPYWNPEWVGCSLILYRNALKNNGARFTILWDNETEYYRHAMDFMPLPQGSAPNFSLPISI
mmetsp:Transcript_12278/g.16849  ORF Transcript_12278/g.16849 Transcript_12278/m.16849 type:complete len:403 (+) Transcript_12278:132-1340(+)